MIPHGEEGHVEGNVPHRRVGFEDGDDSNLDEHEEDWVLPGVGQTDRQTDKGQSGARPTPDTPDPISQTQKHFPRGFRQGLALLPSRYWGPGQVAQQKTVGTQRCPEVMRRVQPTLEKQTTETFPINLSSTSSKPSHRSL